MSDLSTANHNLQAKLDESTAISAQLRGDFERLGKNVDAMLQEKGTLSQALEDAKTRLEELRRAQAAADARRQLFKQFLRKLKSMIDAGQLRVVMRAGRLVIQLPNDVLFDSGPKSLKTAGKQALTELAKVLATVPGRSFQVTGDTDNVPIHTERFPSNWELSTARAVEVVHFLTSQGVDPHALSAAGYGEFDPVLSGNWAGHEFGGVRNRVAGWRGDDRRLAGWIHRRQQLAIAYRQAENQAQGRGRQNSGAAATLGRASTRTRGHGSSLRPRH